MLVASRLPAQPGGDFKVRDNDVPDKTAAGREEINARKLGLNPRQRTLLISLHGTQTMRELREIFRVLGDVDTLVEELLAAGVAIANANAANDPGSAVPAKAPDPVDVPSVAFVRQFMNETAVAALGLRAFLFTLKLERCYGKAELVDLLPEYQRVLAKARDEYYATAMTRRAEEMLARL